MANPEDYIADGIEQTDAPIPRWWLSLFFTLLVLCPFYMIYFHTGVPGRTMEDAYDLALAESVRRQYAEIGELQPDEATILAYMEKENWVKVGKIVFKSQCANCHGLDGQGNIGPNLTDESFKNIRTVEDIAQVILKGANNGAMPAWEEKLHPNEIVLVSAYVANLRGTNVEGGKAAEGQEIDPWPAVPTQGTTSSDDSSSEASATSNKQVSARTDRLE